MAVIGFIGLGHMGGPMSANLVKAGHTVQGFDLVPAALEVAERHGVAVAESAVGAVTGADAVITMLPSGKHVLECYDEVLAAAEPGAHWLDQHNHPGNSVGYAELARELLADIFGDVDYLVSSVGTGGALCGTARELRRYGSHVRTIGVEPAGSIIFGGAAGKYHQSGGGSPEGFPVGTNVEHSLIDEGTSATDVDAFATARVLARRTGLLVGGTAGGAIHVALNRLGGLPDHSTVVALVCDAGEKYLDTIYDDDWMRARGLLSPSAEEHVEHLLDECAGARAGQAAMSGTGAV